LPTVSRSRRALKMAKSSTLNPKGDGALFKAAGLEPGDMLIAVNGAPVSDGADVRSLLAGGGTVSLEVERGGRRMTVSAKTGQ
jgi:general secretion pathway protein C